MKETKEYLSYLAKKNGICNNGLNHIRNCQTFADLIQYYKENPDWCLERNFPTIGFMLSHKKECEEAGIFIDKTFNGETLIQEQAYIMINCIGNVHTGLNARDSVIPMFYIAGDSHLEFTGTSDFAFTKPTVVPVYCFGRHATAKINNDRAVEFKIYSHELVAP